jgi:endoglucanase
MGYVVGFGRDWPKRPYHKGASCPDLSTSSTVCDWDTGYASPAPNYHILLGAMVNGPGLAGGYTDSRARENWGSRVGLLNNAGFVGAVAGLAAGHVSEAKCYQGYGIIQEAINKAKGTKYY